MLFDILVRKIRRNIADHGWWVTFKRGLAELISPVYRHHIYRVYRIFLTDVEDDPPPMSNEFTFRFLTLDDQREINHVAYYAEWLKKDLTQKLAVGDLCLIATHRDGQIAGFNLVSFGDVYIPLVEMCRTFKPDEAWSEHIVVHKPYRRMGVGSRLRYLMFEELKRRRVKRFYGGTLRSNLPALKLARRVGFTEIVDIHLHRVVGFRFWEYRRVRDHAD